MSTSASATMLIAGDLAPIRKFAPLMASAPLSVYGDLLPQLQDSALNIVNLECALSGTQSVVKSGTVFRGSPEHLSSLAPFQVVTLANNHVFDYGEEGFADTCELLSAQGIKYLGAGKNRRQAEEPLRLDFAGEKIALLNFCEGEDCTAAGRSSPGVFGWSPQRACQLIRSLRQEGRQVFVIVHCGLEYIPFPPPYVQNAFRRLARAGAAAVIGHHPHVPQGIEYYHGVPLVYSLGNFAFYQETKLYYRKIGYLLRVTLGKDRRWQFEPLPYSIEDDGLHRLTGACLEAFPALLQRLSAPLPKNNAQAWHGFLKYYGLTGFQEEVGRIMAVLSEDPGKGLAMFRNRLLTKQHSEHWTAFFNRGINRQLSDAPDWAWQLNQEYFTKHV
jgi:hypothetical protein